MSIKTLIFTLLAVATLSACGMHHTDTDGMNDHHLRHVKPGY